ncbi:transglycosylase domain-containing protein [Boudabousia marimammalium]|uniref:Uncharacterized protein n=1 Tax=Boudabousia marimammalium TaxID=156892 RepID=A0A1Q5PT53_9ACTO|nr:transglycosylase domain-containing protein [Boudabousia marimammalium]OKL50632.1 hypothetical protein BM477_01385 [Boudabousia marimammalium]
MSRQTGTNSPTSMAGYLFAFILLSLLLGLVGAGLLLPATAAFGSVAKAGLNTFDELPDEFTITEPSEQSVILAADGSLLARFYAEDRIIVAEDQISEAMKKAIVATEDRRFFQHHGVDGQGVLRAFVSTVLSNDRQGASTLTQQLVKNTLIEAGIQQGDQSAIASAKVPTLGRKVREMNYALALEQRWSKDQILTRYLNIAPFGPNIYGVESASLRYFSVHAKDLNFAQAALLAGITKSPVAYDPLKKPENAKNRRDTVASLLLSEGYIDQKQHDEIVATPIEELLKPSTRAAGCATAGNAAYYCEYVMAELLQNESLGKTKGARRSALMRGGLTIKTSLDPRMQNLAHQAVIDHVPIGDPSNIKMALSSVEPGTGWIRAMAQNTNYGVPTEKDKTRDFVSYNADTAHRGGEGQQTGSSFKPMTLGAWFTDQHSGYEVVGGRTSYGPKDFSASCPEGHPLSTQWKVRNSAGMSPAPRDVIGSTQRSLNTSYADMASKIKDLCKIRDFAIRAGAVDGNGRIDSFSPSSILGTGSVPPLHMANAYATFAAHGKRCQPSAIVQILDRNGDIIDSPQPKCEQTIDPKVADQVTLVLEQTNRFYQGQGFAGLGRPAASKTGTTQNHWNGWLVGYTPQLSTAVWMGHSTGLIPMERVTINGRYWRRVYGSDISGRAWTQYMRGAMEGVPVQGFNSVSIGQRPKAPEAEESEATHGPVAPTAPIE